MSCKTAKQTLRMNDAFARIMGGMTKNEAHDVLCGCGWGRLNCPAFDLPAMCPLCGYQFQPDESDE